ncbi:hypothetical protein N869_04860, partial [Cellulomonas bogoriensis 69B4 = DSM 16987]
MSRALRVVVAGVLAAGGGLVTASAATGLAACPDDGFGYVPGGACQLVVEVEAGCAGEDPVMVYRVASEGFDVRTVTLVWRGPEEHVGLMWDGLPLEGAVPWPGAGGGLSFVGEPGGVTAVVGVPESLECTGTGEAPVGEVPDVVIEPERPSWEEPTPGGQSTPTPGAAPAPLPAERDIAVTGPGGAAAADAGSGEGRALAATGLTTVPLLGA